MPTTRRSTGGARARTGPAKGQSTISFAGKVTKSVPKDVKASIAAPAAAKIDVPERTKPKEEVEHPQPEEEEVVESVEPEKTEAEVQAEKLSDTQINKYWKAIEKERKAPRVHQQGLSVHEKVLRYFDVSSQYGVSDFMGFVDASANIGSRALGSTASGGGSGPRGSVLSPRLRCLLCC